MRASLKLFSFLIVAILAASDAWAQSATLNQVTRTGTLDASGDTVEVVSSLDLAGGGFGSAKVQTFDSYTGTWEVQCSVDGVTYDAAAELKLTPADSTTVAYSVSNDVGIWDIGNAGGCRAIRVVATAGFSGSDTVVAITVTQTGGGSGGGGVAGSGLTDAELRATPVPVSATNLDVQSGGVDLATEATLASVLTQATAIADNTAAILSAMATERTIDVTLGAAPAGPLQICWGSTATPTAMSADGDATAVWCDLNGRLHFSTEAVEDAAETAGAFLSRMGAVVRLAAAGSTATDNENATVNVDGLGLLWTRFLDPCSGVAKQFFPFSIASATTTEITPSLAGASNNYYVCGLNMVVGGANNVALVDDDTDGCASVTSGLAGGTTAATGWNFAANGGLIAIGGNAAFAKTAGTNRVLCLVTSGTAQTSGTLAVVAAP